MTFPSRLHRRVDIAIFYGFGDTRRSIINYAIRQSVICSESEITTRYWPDWQVILKSLGTASKQWRGFPGIVKFKVADNTPRESPVKIDRFATRASIIHSLRHKYTSQIFLVENSVKTANRRVGDTAENIHRAVKCGDSRVTLRWYWRSARCTIRCTA